MYNGTELLQKTIGDCTFVLTSVLLLKKVLLCFMEKGKDEREAEREREREGGVGGREKEREEDRKRE